MKVLIENGWNRKLLYSGSHLHVHKQQITFFQNHQAESIPEEHSRAKRQIYYGYPSYGYASYGYPAYGYSLLYGK